MSDIVRGRLKTCGYRGASSGFEQKDTLCVCWSNVRLPEPGSKGRQYDINNVLLCNNLSDRT
jgi:hypothetical protein